MIFVAIVSCTLKMSISGGWPGGTVVKFAYFTSTALGPPVRILGIDLHTAHRAMLWEHPIQSRRRLAQVWAQGPSSSSKRKNMSISNHLLPLYRNTNDFRMLTLYPMTLLHSFMNSSSLFFCYILKDFLRRQSCHLWKKTVLLLPFQSVCLLFDFLAISHQLRIQCGVDWRQWEWMSLPWSWLTGEAFSLTVCDNCRFSWMPCIKIKFPLLLLSWTFINGCRISSNAFSACHMIFLFNLVVWWITLFYFLSYCLFFFPVISPGFTISISNFSCSTYNEHFSTSGKIWKYCSHIGPPCPSFML